jgi:TolB-like protein/Tfp pilus assembly protein PilF
MRLDSWKEIAAFLNRSVATVQRWERHEGLPVHRLQHASLGSVYAFATELTAWREARSRTPSGAPAATSSLRAVAVLPFLNLSADRDQEYLADAMTDVLITAIARSGAVDVTSRTSVMQHKNSERPIQEIARSLRVDAVIEGSILRVGDRVRITAQLIDAATDRHLWAESYDGDLRDILSLQHDVACAVAAEIDGVRPERRSKTLPVRRVNPGAYDAYVRGMFHLHRFTPEGYAQALSCFQRALEADSDDPLAWAGLAFTHGIISHSDLPARKPCEAFAQVKTAAERAVRLDDSSAEAHAALGGLKLYYEWDWQAAEREFQRALALNPVLAEAHRHYGWYLFLKNRPDEAVFELKRARDAEPLTPLYAAELGWAYWMVGRPGEARAETERALELDADFPVGLFVAGALLRDRGSHDEAVAIHQRAVRASSGWLWALGETYALCGRADLAEQLIAPWTNGAEPRDAWEAFALAYIASALGDRDQAVRGLEAIYTHRHGWTPWACKGVMAWQRIADDPRFQEIAARLNLPA